MKSEGKTRGGGPRALLPRGLVFLLERIPKWQQVMSSNEKVMSNDEKLIFWCSIYFIFIKTNTKCKAKNHASTSCKVIAKKAILALTDTTTFKLCPLESRSNSLGVSELLLNKIWVVDHMYKVRLASVERLAQPSSKTKEAIVKLRFLNQGDLVITEKTAINQTVSSSTLKGSSSSRMEIQQAFHKWGTRYNLEAILHKETKTTSVHKQGFSIRQDNNQVDLQARLRSVTSWQSHRLVAVYKDQAVPIGTTLSVQV